MLFILKKIIGGLLLPLPFLLIVMGIGLLLLWFTRYQKSAKVLISGSWLFLLLFSLQPVADFLLHPIESRYATYRGHQPVKYIVVLGGGFTFNPEWTPSSNLLNNSLPRVTEGVRLYLAQKEYQQAKNDPISQSAPYLVFTGAAGQNTYSNAQVSAAVAISLGIPSNQIITLDKPKDTAQEAEEVAALVGNEPFLLVTSASHLPRAMRFFEQAGLHPIPAAANQLAITTPLNPWEKIFPSAYYLSHTERAWYESLGSMLQMLTPSTKKVAD